MTSPAIASAIPALHTALYNTFLAALSVTTTVVDGPPLSWDPLVVPAPGAASDTAYLFVGARPDDDLSADAQQTPNTLGSSDEEDINVICTALTRGDEQSMPATRQAAFDRVSVLRQALRADQTLGHAVAKAVLASVDRLEQRQQEDGAYAIVLFTVTGRAFLR